MSNGAVGADRRPGAIGGTLSAIGSVTLFLVRILGQCVPAMRAPRHIVQQVYNSGGRSLVIIMLCGLFVGMVLGLQGYDLLARFGSESALGVAAALGLIKELGPVVTALLFAGRAGTSLTSEIGLMRATDQLTAMEMMAVDPVRRVVVPRFLGGVIAMPLLTAIFDIVGLFGSHVVGVGLMGVETGSFWSQMQSAVELRDINEGIIKSVVFGVACSLLAVYQGYHAEPTASGVGLATTRTVVVSAVLTLILDYMLTAFFL
jgi:phospholipid/cholesterol/gamma-HCH transport system permease protein